MISKKKSRILYYLLIINCFFSVQAIPTLKTICGESVKKYYLDHFKLDDLPQEIVKLKNILDPLPEVLQKIITDNLAEDLPYFTEISLPLMLNSNCAATLNNDRLIWSDSSGICVYNFSTNESYNKKFPVNNTVARVVQQAPLKPLFVALSSDTIYLYEGHIPSCLVKEIKIPNEKIAAFSWQKKPLLFLAQGSKIIIASDLYNTQPQFKEISLPASTTILSLAADPNNKFLFVGCEQQPSYRLRLDQNTLDEIPCKKLKRIGISEDGLLALSEDCRESFNDRNHYTTHVYAQADQDEMQKTYSVSGLLLKIKNKSITTIFNNKLCFYNQQGELCKEHELNVEYSAIIPSLQKDSYCLTGIKGTGPLQSYCMIPKSYDVSSINELVYALAVERAISTKNSEVLTHLLDENDVVSSQQIHKRVLQGLEYFQEQEEHADENLFKPYCFIS